MKNCIAIIITAMVAGYFWLAWLVPIKTYMVQNEAITLTLESIGYKKIRVFPKVAGCFTWNAIEGQYKIVTGKICPTGERK